jgi:NADH-quinone oxidoreductase subunit C/D
MSEQTPVLESDLAARFPEAVAPDEREGYEGFIVKPENLLEVAQAVRDELGYDYLSSVTGVDYHPDHMEVVYHLYKTTGGSALVLKTQAPRENAVVPSLVGLYPGADFQEREAWDLMGIRFEGHPDLRRILMWEGFEGHPLRKDWQEAYHEEQGKPFKSRWPEGRVWRSEDKNPFGKNVDYPAGFNPETWVPEAESALYASLARYTRPNGGDGYRHGRGQHGSPTPLYPWRIPGSRGLGR